ncbi:MAG: succinylglutamate desuccinylase/aspartoacylase family protein, partial [Verrucomicrobiales bacterium]
MANEDTHAFDDPLLIGRESFRPGKRGMVHLGVGDLITHEHVTVPVHVVRGKSPGPRIFVCAGIHGDELNGVETIRRLLNMRLLKRLRGDLFAVPVVNLPAFVGRSRYMPDRRDLNRMFPGSVNGSLGSRLAKVFTDQIVKECSLGIDLHTGSVNRPNLPQIRISGEVPECHELAIAFGAPVVLQSTTRSGTLRELMDKNEKPMLMFEGGEALRLDSNSIRFALQGILNIMRHLEMLPPEKSVARKRRAVVFAKDSYWARAPRGGIVTPLVSLGKAVTPDIPLGFIADPFGAHESQFFSSVEGIVIGRTNCGIADEGDGLFHIAVTGDSDLAERKIKRSGTELPEEDDHPVSDDPL